MALPEQLLAAVAQRAADHPGLGHEGDLDRVGALARQGQRRESLDLPLADHSAVSFRLRCLRLSRISLLFTLASA